MPPTSSDSVIVKFDIDDPIALDDLIAGFEGLSSQYRKVLDEYGYKDEMANVRLHVSRISDGCVEAELVIYALLFRDVVSAMDYANIMADFTHRVGRTVRYFAGLGERPANLTRGDTEDVSKFLGVVSPRNNPRASIRKASYIDKDGQRERRIEFEYDFDDNTIHDADRAVHKELEQTKEPPTHKTVRNVLLVWHQTNKDRGKSKGWTGDKATIQAIWPKPLPVFFPAGADALKRSMTRTEENPLWGRAYMVDVDVQYLGETPKVYTILEMHQAIDLDDDEGEEG